MRLHENAARELAHDHEFIGSTEGNEKKALKVIWLTAATMIGEVIAGMLTGSMALLADGWHMATHALALGVTYFAYVMARRYSGAARFSLGTGKFGVLAAYTSALFLGATAAVMVIESVDRFFNPLSIAFNEAIVVAVIGLAVNLFSIRLLGDGDHGHHHDHNHGDHDHHHGDHDHDHNHSPSRDQNLRAAYLHVAADALTSVLAIIALLSGKYLGWGFLDPVMGLVGAGLIFRWAWGLARSSALVLVDGMADDNLGRAVVEAIESDRDSRVVDLHVWPLGSDGAAASVSVVSGERRRAGEYHRRLSGIDNLKHVVVEPHQCRDESCPCRRPEPDPAG